jgi:cytohesin
LHVAVLQGHYPLVELLIKQGADINAPGNGNLRSAPLHMLNSAASINAGHEKIAWALIGAGADLTAADRDGVAAYWPVVRRFPNIALELARRKMPLDYSRPSQQPLLFYLASDEHLPALRYLLENGQSADIKTSRGESLLHRAAAHGQAKLLEYLLGRGLRIDAVSDNGWTPLHYAADSTRAEAVALLLARKANPNARDRNGDTPLHLSHIGNEVSQALVRSGANVRERNNKGWNALDVAVGNSGTLAAQATKFVLEHDGDVKGRDNAGFTALHRVRDPEVVTMLVKAGAEVNARTEDGRVPLHFIENPAVVDALVGRGADVKVRAKDGGTPLHHAAKQGYQGSIAALVRHGADVNAVAADGGTPLHWATKNNPACAEVPSLISGGANVNARLLDGQTALHLIAANPIKPSQEGCLALTINALLSAGADVSSKDAKDMTAYDVAVAVNNKFVADRLREKQ